MVKNQLSFSAPKRYRDRYHMITPFVACIYFEYITQATWKHDKWKKKIRFVGT